MTSTAEACRLSLETLGAVSDVLAPLGPASVHLLGSVGASALGRPRWTPFDATPAEVPYARLKHAEEELMAQGGLGDPVIHRIASVYGPSNRPGRQGLITALASNASKLKTTQIFGRWSTLRNYVHADDVASFVTAKLLHPSGPGVHVLAAQRSHSIAELVATVSAARRRPVPVRLVGAENAEDLTVDPNTIDPGFRARPVETAVRQMILDLRQVPVDR